MKKLFYLLLLLFIAPQVFAGPFDPPPTDQSVNLLGVIFGSSIGSIPLGGAANPVLTSLMEKFNFIIVVVGTVVVSYVTILSVINTAHEGTAMGKKWSAVWVPMRSIAGMALMVPAPASGYSMIQVTVMWIILQGIGAADAIWNIALDGLSSGVSASAGTYVNPQFIAQGQTLAPYILDAAICMQGLAKAATSTENVSANGGTGDWLSQNGQYIKNYATPSPGYPQQLPPPSWCNPGDTYVVMQGTSNFGVVNPQSQTSVPICGSLTVTGSACTKDYPKGANPTVDQLTQAALLVYNTKLKAITEMYTAFNQVSQGLANGQYIQSLQGSGSVSNNPPPPGATNAAAKAYGSAMAGLIVPQTGGGTLGTAPTQPVAGAAAGNTVMSQVSQDIITQGEQNGWITAGSFYFIFNQTLKSSTFGSALNQVVSDPNGTIPACNDTVCLNSVTTGTGGFPSGSTAAASLQANGVSFVDDLNRMAQLLAMGYSYTQADTGGTASLFSVPGSGSAVSSQAISVVNGANAGVMQALANMMTGGSASGDALLAISQFGFSVMIGVEGTLYAIIALVLLVASTVLFPDTWAAMGNTIPIPRIGSYAAGAVMVILGIFLFMLPALIAMWTFGAMLAIYCPLIPFMIFTMAALGWMLTVVEAIIAAPIVALGIVMPSGDELGKLEHALGILANIFLRPMLMIFGFLLASRVFKAVVLLINFGMSDVFNTIYVSTLFSTLVVLAVYASFITTVLNVSFSLIYALPDKLLRWIGISGEHTEAGLGDVKSGAAGMAAQTGGLIKGGAEGAVGKKASEGARGIITRGRQ